MRFTKRLNIKGKMYQGIIQNLDSAGFTIIDNKKCTVTGAERETGNDFVRLTFEELL